MLETKITTLVWWFSETNVNKNAFPFLGSTTIWNFGSLCDRVVDSRKWEPSHHNSIAAARITFENTSSPDLGNQLLRSLWSDVQFKSWTSAKLSCWKTFRTALLHLRWKLSIDDNRQSIPRHWWTWWKQSRHKFRQRRADCFKRRQHCFASTEVNSYEMGRCKSQFQRIDTISYNVLKTCYLLEKKIVEKNEK